MICQRGGQPGSTQPSTALTQRKKACLLRAALALRARTPSAAGGGSRSGGSRTRGFDRVTAQEPVGALAIVSLLVQRAPCRVPYDSVPGRLRARLRLVARALPTSPASRSNRAVRVVGAPRWPEASAWEAGRPQREARGRPPIRDGTRAGHPDRQRSKTGHVSVEAVSGHRDCAPATPLECWLCRLRRNLEPNQQRHFDSR